MLARRYRWQIVAGVMLAPVVYVLSFGPVYWLASHGRIEPNSVADHIAAFVYRPLLLLKGHSKAFDELLEWYGSLWAGPW